MKIISFIIKILVNSPFYPHWLSFLKAEAGNRHILKNIHGDVLEVGAGDSLKKEAILAKYEAITKYTATDYTSWDELFEEKDNLSRKYGCLSEFFLKFKKKKKLDKICSATDLPFENNSFDVHLSFEVLEHIDNPEKYFTEAVRVVRPGGKIIFSVPFLYRIHGSEPLHKFDFFRYANGFFYKIADQHNLKTRDIYVNAGFGTTFAQMINQWLILRIKESFAVFKIFYFFISPFVFFLTNIIGFLIDLTPDKRFATRFHVIFEK